MFQSWQEKYPELSQQHDDFFQSLSPEQKCLIDHLFNRLSENDLLSEELIQVIKKLPYMQENAYLEAIIKLDDLMGLPYALQWLNLDTSQKLPVTCLFIEMLVKDVFSNELCRNAFEMRLFADSDYSISPEPITEALLLQISEQLNEIQDAPSKGAYFFDEMVKVRPIPAAQIDQTPLSELLVDAFTASLIDRLEKLKTLEGPVFDVNYRQMDKMLCDLHCGLRGPWIKKLRDDIAIIADRANLLPPYGYHYKMLMGEIDALILSQSDLVETIIEEFKEINKPVQANSVQVVQPKPSGFFSPEPSSSDDEFDIIPIHATFK